MFECLQELFSEEMLQFPFSVVPTFPLRDLSELNFQFIAFPNDPLATWT